MCFNQWTSAAFATMGFISSIVAWKSTKNVPLTLGVFYFFLMELLQVFQYIWIDQCDNMINKVLTIVGLLHICFQPLFTHLCIYGLTLTVKAKAVYLFLLKLCFLGGVFMFLRWPLSYVKYFNTDNTEGFKMGYDEQGRKLGWNSTCGISPEWLRGSEVCTYHGKKHLAWSVPLATASYYIPSTSLHFFLMFAPFFVMKQHMWVYGLFLMITGPLLASLFSDDLMEQASIWCFFSICQVTMMVFAIRMFLHSDKSQDKFKEIKKDKKEKDKKE